MGSWLRVTNGFAFCAVFAGGSAGRRVSEATLDTVPPLPPDPPPGHELDPQYVEQLANVKLNIPMLHPGTGWAIAAGLGVALNLLPLPSLDGGKLLRALTSPA